MLQSLRRIFRGLHLIGCQSGYSISLDFRPLTGFYLVGSRGEPSPTKML